MATITLRGNEIHTIGDLPAVGSPAPDFTVAGVDMGDVTLSQFAGQNVILNIFPTPTCATSVRKFNEAAAGLENTVVLCISQDLPFAQKRFCGAEGIENVTTGSAFRSSFGDDYGVTVTDAGVRGLTARSVVVIDTDGKVVYTELVPEFTDEPDYDSALAAVNK
jgi:thiol peroxidase